jgi:hypothetical protein
MTNRVFLPLQRRFLAAFADIQGISYEVELIARGKIILDLRNNPVSSSSVELEGRK